MSKSIFVEYRGRHAEVKCNDFNALENGIEKKLGVSLSNHQLDYWHSKRNEWIGIYDDDDLKNISEDTKVRLILKDSEGAPSRQVNITAQGNKEVGQVGYQNYDNKVQTRTIIHGQVKADMMNTGDGGNVKTVHHGSSTVFKDNKFEKSAVNNNDGDVTMNIN